MAAWATQWLHELAQTSAAGVAEVVVAGALAFTMSCTGWLEAPSLAPCTTAARTAFLVTYGLALAATRIWLRQLLLVRFAPSRMAAAVV